MEEDEVSQTIKRILRTDDYFEILCVERDASEKDISKAYKKLALKLHPDKCSLENADEAFKKVSGAFACLRDPDQREHYKRFGAAKNGNMSQYGNNVDPNDLFAEIFRNMQQNQGGGFTHTTFNFQGGPGVSFSSSNINLNTQNLKDIFPSWAQPLFQVISPEVFVGFVLVFSLYLFLSVFEPVLQHLQYFVLILMFIPSQLKKRALILCLVYSYYDSWVRN